MKNGYLQCALSNVLIEIKETDNILATETPGQYEHVTALSPLTMTNVDLLRKISNLTPSESSETGDGNTELYIS